MPRFTRPTIVLTLALTVAVALISQTTSLLAVHEGDTRLVFEPVAGSSSPAGSGAGEVTYAGGLEPESRWTITMQFTGLQPNTHYLALVVGRFGVDGSPEAEAFSPICGFRTEIEGNGGCWYYLVGLRRLGLVELRLGDADGEAVLQASRDHDGPGSMIGNPNAHSFPLTVPPSDTPVRPSSSPVATP